MTAFKQKLRQGRLVSLINTDHVSASLVRALGGLGIDAIMLDCEQGLPGFSDVEHMTCAARMAGMASLVRVPSAQPWTIERYLMRDVDGIVLPRLDTAAQVERAVADVHYAVPARIPQLTIIVQVESASAVDELDGFLAVPDVDCLFIGAVDLAKSLGHAGDYGHPDVMRVLDDTIARIRAAGKPVGFLVKPHDLAEWQRKGVTMLYGHVNDFLQLGARQWQALAQPE